MDKKYALKIIDNYIKTLLVNQINIHSVYLFGSYAKENNNKDSDIDLAIVLDKITNPFNTEIKMMTLRNEDETIIEPHVFEKKDFNMNNPFIYEIVNTGIQIKI